MKKIFFLIAATALFTSCEQDIQTNNPAFQAKKNDVYWKSDDAKVTVDVNGKMTIIANTRLETLILKTSSSDVGNYTLGTDNVDNFASFDYNVPQYANSFDTRVYFGPAYKLSDIINGGSGYSANAAGALTTGGSGSGLRVATKILNGAVTSITPVSRGLGYKSGDLITIVGGNNNAKFKVVNVQQSNGEITITEVLDGKFTGTYKLNAVDENGEVVTFSEGIFYKIPLVSVE